jgi:hypothetical protein
MLRGQISLFIYVSLVFQFYLYLSLMTIFFHLLTYIVFNLFDYMYASTFLFTQIFFYEQKSVGKSCIYNVLIGKHYLTRSKARVK